MSEPLEPREYYWFPQVFPVLLLSTVWLWWLILRLMPLVLHYLLTPLKESRRRPLQMVLIHRHRRHDPSSSPSPSLVFSSLIYLFPLLIHFTNWLPLYEGGSGSNFIGGGPGPVENTLVPLTTSSTTSSSPSLYWLHRIIVPLGPFYNQFPTLSSTQVDTSVVELPTTMTLELTNTATMLLVLIIFSFSSFVLHYSIVHGLELFYESYL